MTIKRSRSVRWVVLLSSILLLLCAAETYGQQAKIRNTAREIRPGVYECVIYLDINNEIAKTIDDVSYTWPPGYPIRKERGKKIRPGIKGFFSSNPFITGEEAIINVLIDYKGPKDAYLSYKLRLFKPDQE